jgi:hypothetical protein
MTSNNRFERSRGEVSGDPRRGVDDLDKSASFVGATTPRRSTSSLGAAQVPNNDWPSVGEYDDPASAAVMSQLLSNMKVPHRVVPRIDVNYATPPIGPFYIWVAPEDVEEAKRILAEGQVSEEELTSQALQEPPPDDA